MVKILKQTNYIECPNCGKNLHFKRTILFNRCKHCKTKFTSPVINKMELLLKEKNDMRQKYKRMQESGKNRCPWCEKKLCWSRFRYLYLNRGKRCSLDKCAARTRRAILLEEEALSKTRLEVKNWRAILKVWKEVKSDDQAK